MKIKWKKLLVILLAAALFAVNIKSFADEAESRRFSVLSVNGNEAFLTRNSKEVKATAGLPVGQGNIVRTGANTKIYLETDDSKTIRLDADSKAEITKSSSKLLKITLLDGTLFFNVDKPLKDDEEMNFNAAQTSMSIRGTSGLITITKEELLLYLIEGTINWNLGPQTITITPSQKVTLKSIPGQNTYQLQSIENFTWENLSLFGLETILEQINNLDLSAIHLTDSAQLPQLQEKLKTLQSQQPPPDPPKNPRIIRVDPPKTNTPRNRGRGTSRPTNPVQPETKPNSSEPDTQPSTPEPDTKPSTSESNTESSSSEADTSPSATEPNTPPSTSESNTESSSSEPDTSPSTSESETELSPSESDMQPSISESETEPDTSPTITESSETDTPEESSTEETDSTTESKEPPVDPGTPEFPDSSSSETTNTDTTSSEPINPDTSGSYESVPNRATKDTKQKVLIPTP